MALTEVNSLGIKDLEVKTADIAAANVTLAKVENVTSGQIIVGNGSNRPTAVAVSGDVTLSNAGAVTIATGAVEHAMLAGDAVDGDNLADNACDSEHYTDGSIDHAHLANDCVDGDNIADNSIGLEHLAGGTDGNLITYDTSGDPAHVATGSSGQVLTSNGAGAAPTFQTAAGGGIGRNLFINGDMRIDQRNNGSAKTIDGSDHCLDRWLMQDASTQEHITVQQVDVAADSAPWNAGFRKALKITNGNQTSGAGGDDTVIQYYKFEAQDIANSGWDYTSSSSYITLSFWVKASVAMDYPFYIRTRDGTARMYSMMTGSLSADTWTKITKTLPGDSNITVENDTGPGLELLVSPYYGTDGTVSSGSTLNAWKNFTTSSRWNDITTTWYTTNDATFETTGFKLEVGDSATDFDFRTYQDELIACQRYFEVLVDGNCQGLGSATCWGTSETYTPIKWRVRKRATPSFEVSDVGHFKLMANTSSPTCTAIGYTDTNASDTRLYLQVSSAPFVNGHSGWVNTTSDCKFSAVSEI